MKEELNKSGINVPSTWNDVDFLRAALSKKYNYKECIELVKKNLNFLNDKDFHTISPKTAELL